MELCLFSSSEMVLEVLSVVLCVRVSLLVVVLMRVAVRVICRLSLVMLFLSVGIRLMSLVT